MVINDLEEWCSWELVNDSDLGFYCKEAEMTELFGFSGVETDEVIGNIYESRHLLKKGA